MYKHVLPVLHLLVLVILLGTFSSSVYLIINEPGVTPVAAIPTSTLKSPTPVAFDVMPETGWSLLQAGLERRGISIFNKPNQEG